MHNQSSSTAVGAGASGGSGGASSCAWHELESDPGVFTLLMERLGVQGVQVDEIYDIDGDFPSGTVYGFIFLFRWSPSGQTRMSRRQAYHFNYVKDASELESVYFAHQVKENSCATHALLSIIMNCMSKMEVGDLLNQIHAETKSLTHYQRGVYFGQHPKLEQYHNSFANKNISSEQRLQGKMMSLYASELEAVSSTSTVDQFHYISFVPINNRLYELDGLKPHPINHGAWTECNNGGGSGWVDKFRQVIRERVQTFDSEVCFNLLCVIPDRRTQIRSKIQYLEANKENMMEITRQLVRKFHPSLTTADDARILSQLRCMSPTSGTLMQKGFFDLQKKITWFKTYPDFLASPLISNQEKQLYFEIRSNLESPRSDLSDTENKPSMEGGQVKMDHADASRGAAQSQGPTDPNACKSSSPSISPSDISDNLPLSSLQREVKREARGSSPSIELDTSSVQSVHTNLIALNSASNCKMEQLFVDTQTQSNGSAESHKDGSGHFFLAAPKIRQLIELIDEEVESCKNTLKEEVARRQKYVIDQKRRSHNYQLFIQKYFAYALKYGLIDIEKSSGMYRIKQKSSSGDSSDASAIKNDSSSSKEKDSGTKSQNSSAHNAVVNGSVTSSNSSSASITNNSSAKQQSKAAVTSAVVTSSSGNTVTSATNSSMNSTATVRSASSPVFSENRRKSKVPKRR